MSFLKCTGYFLYLPGRFLGAEINSCSYCHCTHIKSTLDRTEHNLVELIGVAEKFIVVDFHDERNFVSIHSGDSTKHAKCRGYGIAVAFDSQLNDIFRIKKNRVRR